ncbi:MAG: sigma-70 family RNA polymerase sigma factor [bacterium]|nr:sigma-70 family RNA polymerase sigma factor [bacterium]
MPNMSPHDDIEPGSGKIPELDGPGGVHSSVDRAPERDPAELLERIRRGDADAFEEVAREHTPRLFRLALRLCRRREDAEDLVQETLLKSLPALRKFEGRAKLSTYLVRALTNLWKNRLRSRSRSRIVDWFRGRGDDDEQGPPEPLDAAPSAEERLEADDRAEAVREAVSRLEPTRRLTLLLREVEELSYEEIAEMTEVPVGTVRSRLARARADLRKIFGAGP